MTDAPYPRGADTTEALVPVASAGEEPLPTRGKVAREFALFQVKLIVDGLKDLLLSPLSMVVLVVGLIAPGRARSMWRGIYSLGRGLDDWIDLFPDPERSAGEVAGKQTMDSALNQTEELVRALRRGGVGDPHVQAQLSAVLRSIDGLAASAGIDTATPSVEEPAAETRA
jgi:hypothetical protein